MRALLTDWKIMRMRGFSSQFLDNQPENRCVYAWEVIKPGLNSGLDWILDWSERVKLDLFPFSL